MKTLVLLILMVSVLSAQMQNSAVASLIHLPNEGEHPIVQVSGQPGQYFELWGMLGPTFLGADFTPWGVVDIPIFLGTHVMLHSGYLTWGPNGVSNITLIAPPGMTVSLQAIVGVNHWYYPMWWLTEAITLST